MIRRKVFKFDNYDLIGFNLDHTVVKYNLNALIRAQYDFLVNYLIKTKSYPTEYFTPITDNDKDFVCRGTFIDIMKGNFLQIDNMCQIIKASTGTRQLGEQEIEKAYGKKKLFRPTIEYVESQIKSYKIASWPKMQCYTDYSQCAGVLIFAKTVDYINAHKPPKKLRLKLFWMDIEDGLKEMAKNSALNDSIPNYVFKSDPKLVSWLAELRKTSALMLITDCSQSSADMRMRFAFNPNWRDMFDFIIYNVNRFEFFHGNSNFVDAGGNATPFTAEGEYMLGSIVVIEDSLNRDLKRAPKILYGGGGSLHDILAPHCDVLGLISELAENLHFADCSRSENAGWVLSKSWGHFDGEEDTLTVWGRALEEKTKYCCPDLTYFLSQPSGREYHPHWLEPLDRRAMRERAKEIIKEKATKKHSQESPDAFATISFPQSSKAEDSTKQDEGKKFKDKDKKRQSLIQPVNDEEYLLNIAKRESPPTIVGTIPVNKQDEKSKDATNDTQTETTRKRSWWLRAVAFLRRIFRLKCYKTMELYFRR